MRLGRRIQRTKGTSKFKYTGGSGGVVARTVKDPIPFPAVVVPVAAVNHVLVPESRITAFNPGQNVLRFEAAHLVVHFYRDARRKRDSPEAGHGCSGACFFEIVAGGSEYCVGFIRRDESLRLYLFAFVAVTQGHVLACVVFPNVTERLAQAEPGERRPLRA